MATPAQIRNEQHAALPGELAALGLDPAAISEEIAAAFAQLAAAHEGDTDAAVSNRGAGLELAIRQTLLFEHGARFVEDINRQRKVTMSVLRDDHGFVASTLARLITLATPAAKMTELRDKAAAKAAAAGEDFDPASVDAVTPTRVQQMAIEGAEIRGRRKDARWRNLGRKREPAERHLATAYQQLAALKTADPDQYDKILAALAGGGAPTEETRP